MEGERGRITERNRERMKGREKGRMGGGRERELGPDPVFD